METPEKITYAPDIESYEGTVPAWLIAVSVSLVLWGVYYMLTYWNGPLPAP